MFAEPRHITDINDCVFYHTHQFPDGETVKGQFDLRAGMDDYIGNLDYKGKRVLEIGPASGSISFALEQRGAEVVSVDLPVDGKWDIIPYASLEGGADNMERQMEHLDKVRNSYWYAHRKYNSKNKVIYRSVYDIDKLIGEFDIAIFGLVLLHLRDPFLAMQRALSQVREKAVIVQWRKSWKHRLAQRMFQGLTRTRGNVTFLPNHRNNMPRDTWWELPESAIEEFAGVNGFSNPVTKYHDVVWRDSSSGLGKVYTMVCERTAGGKKC